MLQPGSMSRSGAVPIVATKRLSKDFLKLQEDPVPYVTARPLPSNILEWHYVVLGPEDTPYQGGCYHGRIIFPKEFPFRPPSIYMITPNGRFKCNERLCLSISDFHPESWNPAWSVATILTGLLSFMVEDTKTHGSIESSVLQRKELALQSHSYNLKNDKFCDLFPQLVDEMRSRETNSQQSSLQVSQTVVENPTSET